MNNQFYQPISTTQHTDVRERRVGTHIRFDEINVNNFVVNHNRPYRYRLEEMLMTQIPGNAIRDLLYSSDFDDVAQRAVGSFPSDLSDGEWSELDESPTCPICLLEIEWGSVRCNNSHHFHVNCINAWLENSRTCPMCRCNM